MNFKHPLILTTALGISGFLCKAIRDGWTKDICQLNALNLKFNARNNTNSDSITFHDFIANKWQNTFTVNAIVAVKRTDFSNTRAIDLMLKLDELPLSWLHTEPTYAVDTSIRNNRVRLPEYNDSRTSWQYQFDEGPLIMAYDDFTIYIRNETDDPTGTFYWTIEAITKDNVDHYQHRHLEFLEVDAGPSDTFKIENVRGNSLSVILPNSRTSALSTKYTCKRCTESTFHDVFHQYLKFLTQRYEIVHVCSGCLTAPEPGVILPDPKCVTHTFKIVVCKNNDETFRFECYKIPCEYQAADEIELREYLVPRPQLELEAGGVTFIPTVFNEEIRQVATHADFHSTTPDPWAARVKHSCLLCHPFQGQPYPDMKLKMY